MKRLTFARHPPADVFPLLRVGVAKYDRPGEDKRRAAAFILRMAVSLYVRHAGCQAAALLAAEAVAAAKAAERRPRLTENLTTQVLPFVPKVPGG